MRIVLIAIFFAFLTLIIGPDLIPFNPADDIVYTFIDLIIAYYVFFKRSEQEEK